MVIICISLLINAYWLMMLSIFSCAICHSCNLIWQNIHLIILTIFLLGYLFVLTALFIFWIQALCQINDMQIFHFVFHSFKTIFCRAEAHQLLLLWIVLFCVLSDTFLPSLKLQTVFLPTNLGSCTVTYAAFYCTTWASYKFLFQSNGKYSVSRWLVARF